MRRTPRIAIVGGGLAGLAAAKALTHFDFEVEVFEQASAIGEIGAGINLSSQAVKALRAMGFGDELEASANVSKGILTRDMSTGEQVDFQDVSSAAARYGAPFLTFHRADLLGVLAGGVDPARIHLGHRLARLDEQPQAVRLTFENGATHVADVLIGADGVRSTVRHALYGDDNPQYTGQMVWRALLKGGDLATEILEPTGHIRWSGPGRHLYGYYLRGREVINIVTQQATDAWVEEGWSIAGDPDDMRASFPNPEPHLEALLSLVTDCSKWGLFLREPTDAWGRGRIQLIGDSAHAMLPNAGQGAGQSFEDAYTLARWLDAVSDPVQALENFRRIRIPRVHAIQRRSAANAQVFQLGNRPDRSSQMHSARASMQWIFEYDPVSSWNEAPAVPVAG